MSRKKLPAKNKSAASKIRLRGRDGGPLSLTELNQGLYDTARALAPFGDYRFKWVTLYLTMIDEDGREVYIDASQEITLHPYRSAADENGI